MRADEVGIREVAPVDPAARVHGGRVLMLPGRGYSCRMPLLHGMTRALQSVGWRVVQAEWELPVLPDDPQRFVEEVAGRLAASGTPGEPTLVVGKSLGTLAAAWAADHAYPAVWLTPVLTANGLREVIARYPAPSLVVGGTDDPLWERGFTATGTVLEIEAADHSLEVPDEARTARVRDEVAQAVTELAAQATLAL